MSAPMETSSADASLRSLIATAIADLQRLIKAQIELAKVELSQTGKAAAKTSGLLIATLVMAGLGGLFLLVTIALVIAIWLPVWAGFGIVTLVLFIVAAILGLLGRKAAEGIKGPERTLEEIEKTKAVLSGQQGAPQLPSAS